MTNNNFKREKRHEDECVNCGAPYWPQLPWVKVENNFTHLCHFEMGRLFECNTCKEKWYLNESQYSLYYSPNTRLINDWYDNEFTLSKELLNNLISIGGIKNDHPEYLDFPCRVKTKDGKQYDMAIIRFAKEFPISSFVRMDTSLLPDYISKKENTPVDYDAVNFANEIAEIMPSPYAMDKETRYDINLGDYSTYWNSWDDDDDDYDSPDDDIIYFSSKKTGEVYRIEYDPYFIKNRTINGENVLLSPRPHNQEETIELKNEVDPTIFYACWNSDIEAHALSNPFPFLNQVLEPQKNQLPISQTTEIIRTLLRKQGHFKVGYTYKNFDKLKTLIDAIDMEPVELIFNGIGFRETGEAWDKFDTFNQVGIVRFEPCKDFDDYELRVKILYRKILDKRGYFIFENLNEEALNLFKKFLPQTIDLDQLLEQYFL